MAKFIGIAGDFMKEKALKRRLNALIGFFMAGLLAMLILGVAVGYMWASRNLLGFLVLFLALVLIFPVINFLDRLSDKQIRDSRKEEKGADGERDFVKHLKDLPDTYTVVSDLDFADSYGNIDHLIIGPTGVFSIDVKDWTGTVASDGKGELLLNGKPTSKPEIKRSVRRTMEFRSRVKALTNLDPYIQGVFAFLHTHVEAKWGTTGAVHCIRAEQIVEYITKARVKTPLPSADIPRLIAAAKSLKENAVQTR